MTAAGSALLVALAGAAAVLAVQARLNRDLAAAVVREHSANVALAEAHARVEASNEGLKAANAREVDRFRLALDAIRLFHGEVSEDFLLKEKPFQALRVKLLSGAADFYGKLERRLRDRGRSRVAPAWPRHTKTWGRSRQISASGPTPWLSERRPWRSDASWQRSQEPGLKTSSAWPGAYQDSLIRSDPSATWTGHSLLDGRPCSWPSLPMQRDWGPRITDLSWQRL